MSEYLSFGEIMLRLKSPGHERLFQSPSLEATFAGGEANVAVSLANFGLAKAEEVRADVVFLKAFRQDCEVVLEDTRRIGANVLAGLFQVLA